MVQNRPDLHSGTKGRAFESPIAHHNEIKGLAQKAGPFSFTYKFIPHTIPHIPPQDMPSLERGGGRPKAYGGVIGMFKVGGCLCRSPGLVLAGEPVRLPLGLATLPDLRSRRPAGQPAAPSTPPQAHQFFGPKGKPRDGSHTPPCPYMLRAEIFSFFRSGGAPPRWDPAQLRSGNASTEGLLGRGLVRGQYGKHISKPNAGRRGAEI